MWLLGLLLLFCFIIVNALVYPFFASTLKISLGFSISIDILPLIYNIHTIFTLHYCTFFYAAV